MSQTNAPGCKFPEALLSWPKCLIALSGLDIINNAVHRLVWEEFTKPRPDKKPILYSNFPADHLYPKSSENRLSYEDYSPVGILKRGWLVKHTQELPSLVGFFFDLDWEDPQWDERQTECVSKIEVIRSALEGRASEIVLVLIQSSPPMSASNASTAHSERAAALCNSCELPRLNLFVLPFTQRPQGFIARIEEAFYKKAVIYYTNQVHTVRAHKEMLTQKQSMQLVSIRHQFKMAFFTEMKQDPVAALRLYSGGYNHLTETMYLSDDRVMEFKLVAGFINYKICKLYFDSDEPLSAITQFRKHIDRFSKEKGPWQLAYQHSEWLSRQFSVFADIFSEATKRGLKALQTQNPGLYYHHAALYAIERKQQANQLCLEAAKTLNAAQANALLDPGKNKTYYGQRPWRVGLTDDKPSDSDHREECIRALQALEYRTEHSWQIIPLLTQATAQYKSHPSQRVIKHLKVLMANEYYLVKEWDNALVLLSGVCELYRSEQWWNLLTSVQQLALRCSYLTGQLESYLTTALELTSNYLLVPNDQKKVVQSNIHKILQGQAPSPETGIDSESLGGAAYKWTTLLTAGDERLRVTVPMSSLATCIECKSQFSQAEFTADSAVSITVHLVSSAPLPISLSQLQVLFTQEEYDSWCVGSESIQLEPHAITSLAFSFPASQSSVGGSIEVKAVQALYGSPSGPECLLVWNGGLSETFSSKPLELNWQKITARCSTNIQPCPPCVGVSLNHSPPVLTSEYYPIKLCLVNEQKGDEHGPMTSLQVTVSLPEALDEPQPPAELYSSLNDQDSNRQTGQSLEISCDTLGLGESLEETVYLCTKGEGLRKVGVSVSYNIACTVREDWDPVMCVCHKEHLASIQSVKPFELVCKLLSTDFKTTESVVYDQPFVLVAEVQCTSPWQLAIVNSQLEQVKGELCVTELNITGSQLRGLTLDPGDKATECYCLSVSCPPHKKEQLVTMGDYTIQWRRLSDSNSMELSNRVTFPAVFSKFHPYSVSADIPSSGQLMDVLPLSYTVTNKTRLIQEFEARMGASEAFVYSGNRLAKFRILPESEHTLRFNLLPVSTGLVSLPALDIQHQREEGAAPPADKLPTSIFIKPSQQTRQC